MNLMTWIEHMSDLTPPSLQTRVKLFGFLDKEKQSRWSQPHTVLAIDGADVRRAMAAYRANFLILMKDREGHHQSSGNLFSSMA